MSVRLAAILLAAHLLYAFLLPSVGGKAVSLVGLLLIVSILACGAGSHRFAARLDTELGTLDRSRAFFIGACFALPMLSLVAQPTIAVWRVDARALLILAWLLALSAAVTHRRGAGTTDGIRVRLSLLTQLFILWSAFFWLMIIWDVGVGRAVLLLTDEDRLTLSFRLWETTRPRDHLFLVWLNRDSFEKGIAYSNHLHPIAFFFYVCSKIPQLTLGVPLAVGRNLIPFVTTGIGAVAFALLLPRGRRSSEGSARFHAAAFLMLGFFLSGWHYWVYPFIWNRDTVFPLIACLTAIVWASLRPRPSLANSRRLTAALCLFAVFGWLYTPLVVLSLWCLFGRARGGLRSFLAANGPLVRASGAALSVGTVVYLFPLVLIAVRGYENTGSSWLFRSGLDGDTRYFQDVIDAVFRPYAPARTVWSLVFPVFVPFLAALGFVWSAGKIQRRQFARETIFLLSPYLFSLMLFAQAVSIHPYLYDVLLVLPVGLVGSTWALHPVVLRRLRGPLMLGMLLMYGILLMANLIAIAQRIVPLAPG